MHRRNILWGAVSAFGAAFAASRASAATEAPPTAKLKVVYHLNDLDKVSFVVGNIQNHLDGVGGPDHVTIALVVHGQALRAFHASSANPDLSRRVGQFSKAGLELAACGNTMKSQNVGAGRSAAGLHCRRQRRRGPDRRTAIAGLSLPEALIAVAVICPRIGMHGSTFTSVQESAGSARVGQASGDRTGVQWRYRPGQYTFHPAARPTTC